MKKNETTPTLPAMFSNLAGNSASEISYGLYEKWWDIQNWIPFPFNKLIYIIPAYRNQMYRLNRSALKSRCRAVVLRDRTEIEFYNSFTKDSK